jgi:hypothetical protein
MRFIPGLDCLWNSIYVYLESINRANPIIYAKVWNFIYKDSDNTDQLIGDRLSVDYNVIDYGENLRKYCGINMSLHRETDYDKTLEFLKENFADDRPVGLCWDTFWCPWHNEYQMIHHLHGSILLSMEGEQLKCLDPKVVPYIGVLKLNDLKYGTLNTYVEFEVLNTYETPDYRTIFKESVEFLDHNGMFENMERFIHDFSECFDIKKEFAAVKNCLWDVKIYINLSHIAGYGVLYGEFLKVISKEIQVERLTELAQELDSIYEMWGKVTGQLLTYYYDGYTKEAHQNMVSQFKALYTREKNVYNELKKFSCQ